MTLDEGVGVVFLQGIALDLVGRLTIGYYAS
jgi:hypothetical protein